MALCCLLDMLHWNLSCLMIAIQYLLVLILFLLPVIVLLFGLICVLVRRRKNTLLPHLRQPLPDGKTPVTVGFFHPYCNAGGGGERVLWVAIRALQNRYPSVKCVVYTGDVEATGEEILAKARQRFNFTLPRPVEFVFLKQRSWVEADTYPYFTLLGQSLGSMFLGWEAMMNFVPDIYLDTMGYAFTIPLFKYIGGCKVGCYVHYPTISTDMLARVSDRTQTYNNASFISQSKLLSTFKLIYYHIFAFVYGVAGKRCDVIMVNSSWTRGHIVDLWKAGHRTHVVYPPCDTNEFLQIPFERPDSDTRTMVSIAQFRPEKDHQLQVRAFNTFLTKQPTEEQARYKLVLIGSCRNSDDSERVEKLKKLCEDLGVQDSVEFQLNISFADLKSALGSALIGLHTMWNEHFGIGVVEMMAAGTIVLAHNSGGPKLDIVVDHDGQQTGYLADSEDGYAEAMDLIVNMTEEARRDMRRGARNSVTRFSEDEFEKGLLDSVQPLFEEFSL